MNWKFWQRDASGSTGDEGSGGLIGRIAGGVIGLYLLLCLLLGWWADELLRAEIRARWVARILSPAAWSLAAVAAVLAAAVSMVAHHIAPRHRAAAAKALGKELPAPKSEA